MNPPIETETQETLVWRGTPSQWTNFGTYLFCLILTAGIVAAYFLYQPATPQPLILAGLVLPVFWALARWIGTRCNRYEVTSERAKITTGLLSRRTSEVELYRIRDYTVIEPFWLRLVGCGDVVLTTSDRTTPSFTLHAVPRAQHLKDQIRTYTERMRQRRGVRDMEVDTPRDLGPAAGA
jgi:uncharacterized membrane protein YdbT with pleckstrin-like domain